MVISRIHFSQYLLKGSVTEELKEFDEILRWPRGCARGLKQKRALILQGLAEGHLSLKYPFMKGSAAAINYLSGWPMVPISLFPGGSSSRGFFKVNLSMGKS